MIKDDKGVWHSPGGAQGGVERGAGRPGVEPAWVGGQPRDTFISAPLRPRRMHVRTHSKDVSILRVIGTQFRKQ